MFRVFAVVVLACMLVTGQPNPGGQPGQGQPGQGQPGQPGQGMPGQGQGMPGGMNMASLAASGQTTSTACPNVGTQCALDGSSNFISRNITYSKANGKFSGTIVGNMCSNNLFGRNASGVAYTSGVGHAPICYQQQLPAPAYSSGVPSGAPLRGAVGYSLYGVNIYGPYEAGFTLGQACTVNKGTCEGGWDLNTCENKLVADCGLENIQRGMLMDSCGGHANPYHYHIDMACDVDRNKALVTSNSAGHSPLIGIALDGYGMYGMYESTGVLASLDACGGHFGPVPTMTINGTVIEGQSVYHYHTQPKTPYHLGCYGPVSTVAECKRLYPTTCDTGYSIITLANGTTVNYDADCPCGDPYSPYTGVTLSPNPSATMGGQPQGNQSMPGLNCSGPQGPSVSPSSNIPILSTLVPGTATPSTPAPPVTSVVAASVVCQGTVDTFNRTAFILAVVADLKVGASDVVIKSVTAASVKVDFEVTTLDSTSVQTTLAAAASSPTSVLRKDFGVQNVTSTVLSTNNTPISNSATNLYVGTILLLILCFVV